jgi:hypothetical protein
MHCIFRKQTAKIWLLRITISSLVQTGDPVVGQIEGWLIDSYNLFLNQRLEHVNNIAFPRRVGAHDVAPAAKHLQKQQRLQ